MKSNLKTKVELKVIRSIKQPQIYFRSEEQTKNKYEVYLLIFLHTCTYILTIPHPKLNLKLKLL